MRLVVLLVIALLVLPVVSGLHEQKPVPVKKKPVFSGLKGIFGVSVEPEEAYGPSRGFGRPKVARARLPKGYRGLAGIASQGPGVSETACARFGCRPGKYVVADTGTNTYYRCRCPDAEKIPAERRLCLDTPSLAARIGYLPAPC